MILEGDHQREWREGETRNSRIVFIGRNLDREKLERSFAACAGLILHHAGNYTNQYRGVFAG